MKAKYKFLIIIFLYGCNASKNKGINATIINKPVASQFHKIDITDSNYSEWLSYAPEDTILPSGFFIKYLVLDSTKYKDLYIVWGKGNETDTFITNVLMLNNADYIPFFAEETEEYLIFGYECGSLDCSGILFLSKKFDGKIFNVSQVNYENVKEGIFVYSSRHYEIPTSDYYIFDLIKQDTIKYDFKEEVFLDSVFLDKTNVHLIAYKEENRMGEKVEGVVKLNR